MNFSSEYYGQVTCINGHVATNFYEGGDYQRWCGSCGKQTIAACPSCHWPLRGSYRDLIHSREPDAYCLHCGKALPWTESKLDAVREVAKLVDGLTDNDRKTLNEILPDLISTEATPSTQVAALKMKSLVKKGGKVFAESVQKIIVDVISETAKKTLFP
ncbi:DUF2321 domain-containing protein [Edaphobacter sp. 12200R-103]|uniref:DUF2321 domain-containing protein n=1 Tax=Edaphobacter sp. 12200R-103 TaxID=2703788 RepID=UPI00138C9B9B|nr:DUF2321 domain-containing protein [Edaphobacter sp. 12200R-103]QHS51725.1 DUF2321 domain-containing protein [Edaphobacter sp. 12200R-103]